MEQDWRLQRRRGSRTTDERRAKRRRQRRDAAIWTYGERSFRNSSVVTVDQLVNARMNKRRRVHWSPRDAHRVLQVRAAVPDGRLGHQAIQFAA